MSRSLRIAIAGILLIVVIFVVVHPLVDLEPTVLRTLQTSFLVLAILVVSLFVIVVSSSCRYLATDSSNRCRKDHLSPLDLTCTCLC